MPATVAAALCQGVRRSRHEPAALCGATTLTYDQLWSRCLRIGGALRALGLEQGDRVLVAAGNCHRVVELILGVPAAGLIVVPVPPTLDDATLHAIREDSGARVAFVPDEDRGRWTDVAHVVGLGEDYESLLAAAPSLAPRRATCDDPVAALFYTGGTTGPSKGVALTHGNLMANTRHLLRCVPIDTTTRWLIAAPMFHISGTLGLLATVARGGSHVVAPRFDAGEVLELAARAGATTTLVVPAALAAMAEEQHERPRSLRGLRQILHGGAPIATETLRRAVAAFPDADFTHLYGATETAPVATALLHEQRVLDLPVVRSCGRAVPGVAVSTRRADGGVAAVGEIGEVVIAGPNVMRGYWNRPGATAAVLDGDRYATGDLGYLDSDGHLHLLDRAPDAIRVAGGLASSATIEEVLHLHPAVLEAAAFTGSGDGAIGAAVTLRRAIDADRLIDHCRRLLPPELVPERIDIWPRELPKSPVGKVLKRRLREASVT